jgi:hypothetical protein
MDLKESAWNVFDSWGESVACSFQHGDVRLGSTKGGDWLRDYLLLAVVCSLFNDDS